MQQPASARAPRSLGPDRLRFEGERLVVTARREMPDWKVSRFRRTAVIHDGVTYVVAGARRLSRSAFEYTLLPWPDEQGDRPARTIVYDADYVEARDGGRGHAWLGLLLWPVSFVASPLVGCLWARSKQRLQGPLGIDMEKANRRSLLLEYVASMAFALLGYTLWLDASLAPFLGPLSSIAIGLVLLADAVLRYDHLLHDPYDWIGVGEWIRTRFLH